MGRDWRTDIAATGGISFIVGIWLIVSPVVLDYGTGDAAWNPIVCGALVALLTLGLQLGRATPRWPSVGVMVVAAWLYVSGYLLASSALASWNAWAAGALLFFLSAVGLAAREWRQPA